MEFGIFIAIAVGILVIGVVVSIMKQKADEARRLALSNFATSNGFEYLPGGLPEPERGFNLFGVSWEDTENGRFMRRFMDWDVFQQGHSQEVRNLLVKRLQGRTLYALDYSYKITTSNSKTTTTVTHEVGVVAIRVPLVLPNLSLHEQNFLHTVAKAFGFREMTLESEEFNRMYLVRTGDERRASDLLHPQAIEYLLRFPADEWYFSGSYMLLIRRNYLTAEEVEARLGMLIGFADLIPDYMEQDAPKPVPADWRQD